MNGQNRLRCVRRDVDHGCDPSFVEDPTGSTSIVMVSLVCTYMHTYAEDINMCMSTCIYVYNILFHFRNNLLVAVTLFRYHLKGFKLVLDQVRTYIRTYVNISDTMPQV